MLVMLGMFIYVGYVGYVGYVVIIVCKLHDVYTPESQLIKVWSKSKTTSVVVFAAAGDPPRMCMHALPIWNTKHHTSAPLDLNISDSIHAQGEQPARH